MNTNIIPKIKELKTSGAELKLSDYSLTDMFTQYIPVAGEIFDDFGIVTGGDKPIYMISEPSLSKEEYRISAATDKIEVYSSSPQGAYYALCSLAQLASVNGGVLEAFEAHDMPDMSFRAFSDDISRGQISTLDNFKSIVKRCSYFKYNVYMPYIEDTLEIPGLPDFGKYSDPVPVKEWQELCAYARSYNVSVRPIVNMLGHWNKNSVMHDFRKYMLLKTAEDGTETVTSVLDPRKPAVRKLLLKILDATVEAFGEGIIHVGGDEPTDLKNVLGIEETARLYVEHFNWLAGEIEKRNCTMQMYSDMFTPVWGDYHAPFEAINGMKKTVSYVYWDYGIRSRYDGIDKLAKNGCNFVVSPASRSYNRLYPTLEATFENCRLLAAQAKETGCDGFIMSSWNDGGTLLREENMISVSFGGEFAWNNNSKRTMKELTKAFLAVYYGFDEPDAAPFLAFYNFEHEFKQSDLNVSSEISTCIASEFWKDARKPTTTEYDLPRICSQLFPELGEAQETINELTPRRNKVTLDCFKFDISRFMWACMKIFVVPTGAFDDREAARSVVDDLIVMAEEFERFKKENKRLWFKTNRQSEWNFLESRYIDTENSLYSLIRYCKYGRHLGNDKYMTRWH